MNNNRHLDGTQCFKSNANICFTCENACGKCPWSAVDQKTGHVKFDPVPGWTAEKVLLRVGKKGTTETYHITECPLYKPTRKGRS